MKGRRGEEKEIKENEKERINRNGYVWKIKKLSIKREEGNEKWNI